MTFPKIRGTPLGVPIIRADVYYILGFILGSAYFGKLQFHSLPKAQTTYYPKSEDPGPYPETFSGMPYKSLVIVHPSAISIPEFVNMTFTYIILIGFWVVPHKPFINHPKIPGRCRFGQSETISPE